MNAVVVSLTFELFFSVMVMNSANLGVKTVPQGNETGFYEKHKCPVSLKKHKYPVYGYEV